MVRLTNRQSEALIKLRDHGPRSAYPGIRLDTLQSLAARGLVNDTYELGSMAMPHTNIKWTITPSGIQALEGTP